jgi:glycosyltransferase involved in cell wall biosynthesis
MNASCPKVSVIIPAYNAAPWIAETITSVQQQTFTDWELWVIDDGSGDRTAEIVAHLETTDTRIRSIRQTNQGVSAARNLGIIQSQGELLAFLDADDRWLPSKLITHLQQFEANPHLGVSFDRVEFLTQTGTATGQYSTGRLTGLKPQHLLSENPTTTTSSWVVRRIVFDQVGGFCPTMNYSEDLEWLLRVLCAQQWHIEGLSQGLTRYRTSSGGLSADLSRMEAGWNALVREAQRYAPSLVAQHFATAQAIHLRYLARRAVRLGLPAGIRVDFMTRSLQSDRLLLLREPRRTLLTLLAVYGQSFLSRLSDFRNESVTHTPCITPPQPSPYKGEGASPCFSPLYKGGLRGVVQCATLFIQKLFQLNA